jgi:hypothetical protein
MTRPLWLPNPKNDAFEQRECAANPAHVAAVIETICSDALLDGYSDMAIARMASRTGLHADTVDLIIGELIANGLVHVRHSAQHGRRILEPGASLRAVYRLIV